MKTFGLVSSKATTINNDEVITGDVAIQLLEVINVVDVESNKELGPKSPNAGFSFHGSGYKGIHRLNIHA